MTSEQRTDAEILEYIPQEIARMNKELDAAGMPCDGFEIRATPEFAARLRALDIDKLDGILGIKNHAPGSGLGWMSFVEIRRG